MVAQSLTGLFKCPLDRLRTTVYGQSGRMGRGFTSLLFHEPTQLRGTNMKSMQNMHGGFSLNDQTPRVPALACAAVTLLLLLTAVATAGENNAFSFAVYGDSRSMMYLPPGSDQKEEAVKLIVEMFELVMPEKIAEAVVRK